MLYKKIICPPLAHVAFHAGVVLHVTRCTLVVGVLLLHVTRGTLVVGVLLLHGCWLAPVLLFVGTGVSFHGRIVLLLITIFYPMIFFLFLLSFFIYRTYLAIKGIYISWYLY